MIGQMIHSICSKLGEKLVEYGLDTMGSNTNTESTLENLARNLKSLSGKAYDVEKEISIVERSSKKKRKREVENWLEEVKEVESEFRTLENEVQMEGFIKRYFAGDRATKLNARVCELVEQSRHFGELLLDDDTTRGEALLATRFVGQAFPENLERIWELLVIDQVPCIGIHGMGGVGKTALAKHINNRVLERTNDCVFWLTISQECSIKMLQDKIAHLLGQNLSDEDDEDKRAARLNRALSLRKNIVLILDDVWRYINLEIVGVPHFVEGCKLIITSRSLEVCRQIRCQKVISIKPLGAEEGWNLFRERLGQETALAPKEQEIAMAVAKVCNGLPLGIITLAGSMKGETDIRVWRNALTELQRSVMGHDEMDAQVFKILKYSFDRLDPNRQRQIKGKGYTKVQLCFLYCSLYPEDCEIWREELVRKFISEELVDRRKSMEAKFDEGYSILNILVNVSLLESASVIEEGDCVRMHDLVRAMALKITDDTTMVITGQYSLQKIPNEKEWTMDLEKVSLMRNEINDIPLGMSPHCPKLSTLLLQNNPLMLIPESFFSQMRGLRTLDLSENPINELPNSLSDLENLKALLLGGCYKLESVPYLGKLKALTELDLTGTRIREVPKGMEELHNLKYLSISNTRHLQTLPTSLIFNLPCLQLLCLPGQIRAQLEEIERLKQLEVFEGRLKDMCDFKRFIESGQNEKHRVKFRILVGEYEPLFGVSKGFHKRRNKLGIYRYDLSNRKMIVLADDIQDLVFYQCEGLSNSLLDDLSNPRSLEILTIVDSRGIECILTYEQFMAPQEIKSRFQVLRQIVLRGLDDFMGVIYKREKIGVVPVATPPPPKALFSSLRDLHIDKCNKMKKPGLPISVLQQLETICIVSCEEIEEIIEVADGNTRREGDALAVSLPELRYLYLVKLPRLKSICKATMICNSIEMIDLIECRELKKLPLHFPAATATAPPHSYYPPPALKYINVLKEEKEWWDSLEWKHPTHFHLLQPFVRLRHDW